MSFAADISDSRVEKISLVAIYPRVRVLGWTNHSGSVYRADFPYGVPDRAWCFQVSDQYENELSFADNLGDVTLGAYYDPALKRIYVDTNLQGNPDGFLVDPGVTVSFGVHIASSQQFGLSNPMEPSSTPVEWEGKLLEVPFPVSGSTDSLFGFLPNSQGAIRLINDGWFSPKLDSYVYRNADVKVYILTGRSMDEAIASGGARQVFLGFVTRVSEENGVLNIECSDYLSVLDNKIRTSGLTYNSVIGSEGQSAAWLVRNVYGVVDSFRPVNMAVGGVATYNNRSWGCISVDSFSTDYIQFIVDHTKANTSTKTFTTTTPKVQFGDTVTFPDNPGCFAAVTNVDYVNNFFEHTSISRTVVAGDHVRRYFIGNVFIVDRVGNSYLLQVGVHYNTVNFGGGIYGFTLVDNFEALANVDSGSGLADTPFDPAQDKIVCRVYGTTNLGVYSDSTDVLSVSKYGGVASRSASIIYALMVRAQIPARYIDKATWEIGGAESMSMGLAVPHAYSDSEETRTYKDVIADLLSSDLLNMNLINSSDGAIKIGLSRIGPITGATDYEITDKDFNGLSFADETKDIYYSVQVNTRQLDTDVGQTFSSFFLLLLSLDSIWVNNRTLTLYKTDAKYTSRSLHNAYAEGNIYVKRLAYILSQRRRLFTLDLPQSFIGESFVGKTFTIKRDLLPGFPYTYGAENEIKAVVVEAQKTIESVRLTLDDQKGIQDNLGVW